MSAGDIIFDYDVIVAAMLNAQRHQHDEDLHLIVMDVRSQIIRLGKRKQERKIWIIATRYSEKLKQELVGTQHTAIHINTPIAVCMERLQTNPDGRDVDKLKRDITRYFAQTTDNKSFYDSAAWQKKRSLVLRRDEYNCRECARFGRKTPAETVHHIKRISDRPDLKLKNNNLISLCADCHKAMHNNLSGDLTDLGVSWVKRIEQRFPETK